MFSGPATRDTAQGVLLDARRAFSRGLTGFCATYGEALVGRGCQRSGAQRLPAPDTLKTIILIAATAMNDWAKAYSSAKNGLFLAPKTGFCLFLQLGQAKNG